MDEIPIWALTLVYWLHMLATVLWIGGLASLSLLFIPAARKTLDAPSYAAFLGELQRRFDPLGWFSLALLAGTGMVQMGANPNYQGLLSIENRWAVAIFIKHILFLGMGGLAAFMSWGILPGLRRLALRRSMAPELAESDDSYARLQQQEKRLLLLNLVLGFFVLGLTALARAS